MTVRKLARLFFVLIATVVGLTEAKAQTEFPPAYNNQAHYAVGDLVTDYGNLYRCQAAVTKPYLDPSKTYANWELFYVRNNTTIPIGVGQTFPTLAIAWKYVHNARVAQDAYLHLSIATTNGNLNETFSAPLNLDMDNGAQVSIIGDNEANISLTFSATNGFTIDTNHSLASISGITLIGQQPTYGIYSTSNATIGLLSNISVSGFGYSVYADQSSSLNFGSDTQLLGCGVSDCRAQNGAAVSLGQSTTIDPNNDQATGLDAEQGGRIFASNVNIQAASTGVYATWGGYIVVNDSTIMNCYYGCECRTATIDAESCSMSDNTEYDFFAFDEGVINARTSSGTTSATYGGVIFT